MHAHGHCSARIPSPLLALARTFFAMAGWGAPWWPQAWPAQQGAGWGWGVRPGQEDAPAADSNISSWYKHPVNPGAAGWEGKSTGKDVHPGPAAPAEPTHSGAAGWGGKSTGKDVHPGPAAPAEPKEEVEEVEEAEGEADRGESASKRRRQRAKAARALALKPEAMPKTKNKDFNIPFAHRLVRKSPKEVRKAVYGLIQLWKKELDKSKLSTLLGHYIDNWLSNEAQVNEMRECFRTKILADFGMEDFRRIKNVHRPEQMQELLFAVLWPGGPRLADMVGDAVPYIPAFPASLDDNDLIWWDFYFTDYDPDWWPDLFPDLDSQEAAPSSGSGVHPGHHQSAASSGAAPSSGSGVHPGRMELSGPGQMFEEQPGRMEKVRKHPCNTKSFWIQFHASNVYASLTCIGSNFIARSETQAGEEIAEDKRAEARIGFETAGGGRGVYTSADWNKAMAYSVPMYVSNEHRGVVKMVMMVRVPGDLSPDGVGVCFPALKTLPWKPGQKAKAWWGYDGPHLQEMPKWIVVDRHNFADDLAAARGTALTAGMFEQLRALPHDADVAGSCRSICTGLHKGSMPLNKKLQDRMSRHAMERDAKHGHTGETPWTNMTCDGLECVSSGCHVIGFFVGYSGYNANNKTITPSRRGQFHHIFDRSRMPSMMKKKY